VCQSLSHIRSGNLCNKRKIIIQPVIARKGAAGSQRNRDRLPCETGKVRAHTKTARKTLAKLRSVTCWRTFVWDTLQVLPRFGFRHTSCFGGRKVSNFWRGSRRSGNSSIVRKGGVFLASPASLYGVPLQVTTTVAQIPNSVVCRTFFSLCVAIGCAYQKRESNHDQALGRLKR
jgi:hypothetical protein